MKYARYLLILSFLSSNTLFSQSWHLLSKSPSAAWRHDDLFFINADTGWVVNVDGYIYKTTNGGNSWSTLLYKPSTSFRCVGFANKNKGWAGNLGTGSWSPTSDTFPLYQTNDGGNTWQQATNITGPLPKGICGIWVVDSSVVYAVGRVGGPGFIMKTVNGGASWTSTPAPSPMFYLIDCIFFSADTGLVAGCTGTAGQERFAIFRTTNGGQSWQTVHHSDNFHGICWKISFPSRQTGYASVEAWNDMDSIPVLKTTDGGITWTEKMFSDSFNWNQGIGFINDSTGWCGAKEGQVKQTTNGADQWDSVPFVANFNRFRKINDTVAYASGQRIWKYSGNQGSSFTGITHIPDGLTLDQNYPNPFCDKTLITYHIPAKGYVLLRVYDWTGRPVRTLVNEIQNEGRHEAELTLPYFYDVPFYYSLTFEGAFLSRKAIMVNK